ncbi:hypothetical protein [Herbaspirillum sp. alder98]|uniref:hypothetical protein n=1 Tax=Herbaspirillum sp. alder98 TaxID=2913096 RepID=UPI001CD89EEA|nr:hypothetical protein [Herbaspirillum sp. alder98]MCA1326886.1 hypothetical protein [Herbaspirillum sp. alder98]
MAKDAQQQRINDTSQDVDLPGLEADRVIQASDEEADALDDLQQDEQRGAPPPLREEDIGLARIAGIDEAEVGRELNVSGDEDDDEDDAGNPVGAGG